MSTFHVTNFKIMNSTFTSLKEKFLASGSARSKSTLLLFMGICASHAVFSQTTIPCFSSTLTSYTVGTHPVAIANARFNILLNKPLDLAVLNQGSNDVSTLIRGAATGSLAAAASYSVQNLPTAIAVGYVNTDVLADIVISNESSNTISVLTNTSGGFTMSSTYTTGNNPKAVALQDLNNDYHSDLIVANSGSDNIMVMFGSLSGNFSGVVNYATGTMPVAIHSNDFNGDGYADLAVANRGSNDISILLGSASGTFAPSLSYSVGINPEGLTSGYFNADGYIDLATANAGSDNVSILFGSATGTFAAGSNYAVGTAPNSIAIGDFDLDGYQDLATANGGSDNASILFGSQTGVFSSATHYNMGNSPHSIISLDIDESGAPDLIVTNYTSNTISILHNGTLKFNFAHHNPGGTTNPICEGTSNLVIWQTNTTAPANTYTWSTGDIGYYTTVNPAVTTTYTITGMSVPGCSYTAATTVTVIPRPNIGLAAGDSIICLGESATLKAYGGVNYVWFLPGSAYNSRIVTPTVTTQYEVIGLDAYGCSKIAYVTVNVSLCTGIEDPEGMDDALSVYPNPSSGILNLLFSEDLSFADISMNDLQGRQVYAYSYKHIRKDDVKTISFDDLAPGLYFLNMNTSHYSGTHKIIVH